VPVLVLTPSFQAFDNVGPGFQATYILTAKNEGLIQMQDLTISGQQDDRATLAPLITYVPVLLPQQSVDIPMTFTYNGSTAPGQQGGPANPWSACAPKIPGIGSSDMYAGFIGGIAALAQAKGRCIKDNTLLAIVAVAPMAYKITQDAVGFGKKVGNIADPGKLLAIPVNYLSCVMTMYYNQSVTVNPTGVPQATLQDFQVNGQNCEDTPDYDTGSP